MPPPSCSVNVFTDFGEDSLDRALIDGLAGEGPVQVHQMQARGPWSTQWRAICAGSSENTVTLSMSPDAGERNDRL